MRRNIKALKFESGQKVGNCTFVSDVKSDGRKRRALFKCGHCGRTYETRVTRVIDGISNGCGCTFTTLKHGNSKRSGSTSEYNTWAQMKERCQNPNDKFYKDYGGRGISVCERWKNSFGTFLLDMGTRPTSKHSLDRRNVDGPYSPENCRWADPIEQANNTRSNVFLTHEGKRQTIAQWAREKNMIYGTLQDRLYNGWPVEKALSTPVKSKSK